MLEEFLASEVALLYALLGQAIYDLGFGCYRGMVGARHPEGILAVDAGLADEYILYGVVEHVAHVEHTRHVGRRNHDGVGFA